jgi:transmembrane sensor
MVEDDDRVVAAARWHAESQADTMDWAGFTAWLEADPRNREVYGQVSLIEVAIDQHRSSLAVFASEYAAEVGGDLQESRPRHRNRWAAGLGLLAATLVAGVSVQRLAIHPDRVFATTGISQTIALEAGYSVTLAPHSKLVMARGNPADVRLSGGAFFSVRHDQARTLRIAAGSLTVSDIGTQFDVQVDDGAVRVGVNEGQVRVGAANLNQPLTVSAGRALLFDARQGLAVTQDIARTTVGGWRSGQLSYRNVPLALVAADLGRYAGATVAVSRDIRDRPFTGTLAIGDEHAAIQDLARLMGLDLSRDAGGYRLQPARH